MAFREFHHQLNARIVTPFARRLRMTEGILGYNADPALEAEDA
jgi:hypothetical protein